MSNTTDILDRLKKGEFESPTLLADYLVQLSASLMSAGSFELEARIAYSQKWIEIRKDAKSDKMADMQGMAAEEYRIWQRMVIANKAMLETIRALKRKLRSLEEEMTL